MTEYMDSNRALWDELTPIHERSDFYDLPGFKKGGVRLRPFEIDEVGDVTGKDLLHLQCHFGIDTLSWARLGAQVTGADFSEPAIELARSIADDLHLAARFVCSNVYDLPEKLEGDFDVVYTSRGVLCWLPDIERWANVIAHFLRPGGLFYITEMHPIGWAFDDDDGVTELRFRYPYWHRNEPFAWDSDGSYADPDAHVEHQREYGWNHSLGEIVSSLATVGLRIEWLHEWPFADWRAMPFMEEQTDGTWRLPKELDGLVPLSYSLGARKT
jgi:SAM-dependent methyltransferase